MDYLDGLFGSKGIFEFIDSEIKNNTYGIRLGQSGTLSLSDTVITGNKYGVSYYNSYSGGDVSGNVVVKDNEEWDLSKNGSSNVLQIKGALSGETVIAKPYSGYTITEADVQAIHYIPTESQLNGNAIFGKPRLNSEGNVVLNVYFKTYLVGNKEGFTITPVETGSETPVETVTDEETGEEYFLLEIGKETTFRVDIKEGYKKGDDYGVYINGEEAEFESTDDGTYFKVIPTGTTEIEIRGIHAIEESDPITIESVSLALKEKIEARFYVYVPDSELNTTDINLTFNGKTTTYHAADITPKPFNDKPCRIVSVATFAKQMRDDIKVTVTKTGTTDLKYLEYKDEDVTNGMIFKIEDYVKLVKEKSTDEKLIDLVNKMDNYGKYAQIQFNYNLDSFDKADDIPADYDDSRLEQYAAVNNDNGITGLEFSAVSLELESDSGVRVYYNLTGSDKIGTYTFKVDGKPATPVKKGSLYYVAVKGIPARLMHKPHTVVVTDKDGKTLSTEFSALTYSSRVVANENATESLKNLARSIDLYAEAALTYFGE